MDRVLEECDRAAEGFAADPVHDLRVALRRCRSLADGMIALDPNPEWKAMKKAGKRLFQRLGSLRDIQVMVEWLEKLDLAEGEEEKEPGVARASALRGAHQAFGKIHQALASESRRDPATDSLLKILRDREAHEKHEARAALDDFDRKRWRQWSHSLPVRAARIRQGSPLFQHLALESWAAAYELHRRALRNRSQTAYHALRIGIKRFRYIVENFLPAQHAAWGRDLKGLQDLLGDVHDLDVLWATAVSSHVFADSISRQSWRLKVLDKRNRRIQRYRVKMTGPDSLWPVWRAAFPHGKQIQAIAATRLKFWARQLDPDFAHSQTVATLALQLYDGLACCNLLAVTGDDGARSALLLAALLHDVGRSKRDKGHHKVSYDLINALTTPLGLKTDDLRRAAIIARFHRGALPSGRHALLHDLSPAEQKIVFQLIAILRLANAMDAFHDGKIGQLRIENAEITVERNREKRTKGISPKPTPSLARNEPLIIAAEGYSPGGAKAQIIASERHLLEIVLRRPVILKPLRSGGSRRAPGHARAR
jgi:CHAD domain-containing protein